VVTRRDALDELEIEIELADATCSPESPAAAALSARVGKAIQDRLLFRPTVRVVAHGTLPRFEMKARRVVRK
jgi:phenylacetate-CoA ligase